MSLLSGASLPVGLIFLNLKLQWDGFGKWVAKQLEKGMGISYASEN